MDTQFTPIRSVYGSCLDIDFSFFDADGEPQDISGDDFGILSASHRAFNEAVFTKTDAAGGKLHMFLSAEDAKLLGMGNVNWFRLRRTVPGGCEDNITPIYVSVQ